MTTNCIHPIGYGLNTATGERFSIPDKSWYCPTCSKVLKNKLMDSVKLFFINEQQLFFCTLTERRASGRDIMKDAHRLHNSLKFKYPQLRGFWIKEFTKAGERHLHMIMNIELTKEYLSHLWRKSTKGTAWQIDITPAYSVKSPAAYMMKYMTKQLDTDEQYINEGLTQFHRGERRFGFWKPKGEKVPKPGQLDRDKSEVIEVTHERHWNISSKYWRWWYDRREVAWGEPFHQYMEWVTLGELTKLRIKKLNFDEKISPSYDHIFTEVEQVQLLRPNDRYKVE